MATQVEAKDNGTTTTTTAPAAPKAKPFGNLPDGFYPATGMAVVCGQAHNVRAKRKPSRAAVSALKTHLKSATDRDTGTLNAETFLAGLDDTLGTLTKVRLSMSKDADGKLSGIRLHGAISEERDAQVTALGDAIDQII